MIEQIANAHKVAKAIAMWHNHAFVFQLVVCQPFILMIITPIVFYAGREAVKNEGRVRDWTSEQASALDAAALICSRIAYFRPT